RLIVWYPSIGPHPICELPKGRKKARFLGRLPVPNQCLGGQGHHEWSNILVSSLPLAVYPLTDMAICLIYETLASGARGLAESLGVDVAQDCVSHLSRSGRASGVFDRRRVPSISGIVREEDNRLLRCGIACPFEVRPQTGREIPVTRHSASIGHNVAVAIDIACNSGAIGPP